MHCGYRALVSIIFTLILALPAHADLIITAPPRENAEQGIAQYGPIAAFLEQKLGTKVNYVHPPSWEKYAIDMRDDKYDIVFDGPHFSAWRMKHLNHVPLVKLPGDLIFYVVTNKNNKKISKLRHLRTRRTCGIASPNLSMLTFLSKFSADIALPPVLEIKGGIPQVYRAFKEGKCDAAILRDDYYDNQLSSSEKQNLKIVYKSEKLPNQTITASRRVDKQTQDRIIEGLLDSQGSRSALALLNRFSRDKPEFMMTEARDYKGAETLLEGIVWGW